MKQYVPDPIWKSGPEEEESPSVEDLEEMMLSEEEYYDDYDKALNKWEEK